MKHLKLETQKLITILSCLVLLLPACTKKTIRFAPWIIDPNIAISGSALVGDNSIFPTYWDAEGQNMLSENTLSGDHGIVYKIKFINGVRYMAGTLKINDKYKGVIWANENVVPFITDADRVVVTDLAIDGTDIYACGYETKTGINTAVYWKNGDRFVLEPNSYQSKALTLNVTSGTIIIGGSVTQTNGNLLPALWTNGVLEYLPTNNSSGEVSDLFEYNQSIFATGTVGFSPQIALWINSDLSTITIPSGAANSKGNAIAVTYEAGEYITHIVGTTSSSAGVQKPYIWNDKIPTALSQNAFPAAEATDIVMKNNDFYIAGILHRNGGLSMPAYWKNGTLYSSEEDSDFAQADAGQVTSIAVK
jgi:hypothetical protein